MAVALIAFAVMMLTSSVQACWATIHELVPEQRVGGVSGFIHLLSNISGIIGPTATGLAVQYLGGYSSAFIVAAAIAAAGVSPWRSSSSRCRWRPVQTLSSHATAA